jgi:hypothetical protein
MIAHIFQPLLQICLSNYNFSLSHGTYIIFYIFTKSLKFVQFFFLGDSL